MLTGTIILDEVEKKSRWGGPRKKAGTHTVLTCPQDSITGSFRTGIPDDVRKELETKIGIDLSPRKDNLYWVNWTFKFKHGETRKIDLSKEDDLITYYVLKEHSKVQVDEEDKLKKKKALFTALDYEAEAQKKNKARELKAKSFAIMSKLTTEDMKDILIALGKSKLAIGQSPSRIEASLGDYIESGMEAQKRFLSLMSDPNRENRFLAAKFIDYNILRKSRNGIYYGDDLIASGMEDLVQFISEPKNSATKKVWTDTLNAKLGHKVRTPEEMEESTKSNKNKK